MQRVKPGWNAGIVLVCTNQRGPDAAKPSCGAERGNALRLWLKDRIEAEGLKGEISATKTSCLGVCSADGVTVDIVPSPGRRGERQTLVVDPEMDREALWARCKALLLVTREG